ncbi:cytochrome P450 89A2-like [Oryza brachyantha]|uniref:cytochrome P450 89A2-like n=1 Tax=Oryza brachyantha TaxID=4533 RepID=UPI001AD9FB22|nr:cytochrome P450 89A2-like [Oryza brachyantha]
MIELTMSPAMAVGSSLPCDSPPLLLSFAIMVATVLCVFGRLRASKRPWNWKWNTAAVSRDAVLRLVGIRLGDVRTVVVRDGAVAVDSLVRRADVFSTRPAGSAPTSTISGGRVHNINTVPYGPLWVALRRNLSSEAFHPVRGLAGAAPHRARALASLVVDVAARSGAGGVVPVRDCLSAALFSLNVATCFGDGVDGDLVETMRVVQHEFLSFLSKARVFGTFQKVARLVYRDRWKKLVHYRRRQQEMYLPLIRARKEQRRTQGTTSPSSSSTAYVDTLLDLEVPAADGEAGRRKLTEGEMVGLVSEYLGATTGTVLAELEYILANLILRPDVQSRLRAEVEAAGGEPCAYLRAVIMESLRLHPPVSSVQRHMGCDVVLGDDTHAAQGSVVSFAIEEIGRDNEIWASAQEFRPERFMPGGEGEGVRLALGSKHQEEATKVVKMMPFGAGRRRCPGMGYAMLHLEYFLASLVAAFEWRRAPGEDGEVDLTADYGFITAMQRPLRALVVPRTPPANARSCVGVAVN